MLAAHRRPAGRLMVPDEEVGFLDLPAALTVEILLMTAVISSSAAQTASLPISLPLWWMTALMG